MSDTMQCAGVNAKKQKRGKGWSYYQCKRTKGVKPYVWCSSQLHRKGEAPHLVVMNVPLCDTHKRVHSNDIDMKALVLNSIVDSRKF